jgi:thiamine biosynthesis lipoprotein
LLLALGGCEAGARRYSTEFYGVFDTEVTVIAYADSEGEFERFAGAIQNRFTELHKLFDIYHEYEGVNNLYTVNQNAGIAPVPVAPEIIGLLRLAREGYELSGGTVDVTMGPVLRLWHEARAGGTSLPSQDELREAAKQSGMESLIIDESKGTAFLAKTGMALDVGAVAKGYAASLAAQETTGVTSFIINAGGSVTAAGQPSDGRGSWSVGVQNPEPDETGAQTILDTVSVSNLTVSCSGSYRRFFTVGGKNYHHIIDPATLMPAEGFAQIAVLHPDAGLADVLSTALFILPYEDGLALAARCGAEALWVDGDGNWLATEGYKAVSETYLPAGGVNGDG